MKIGILGTGPVGKTVAVRLAELRHEVFLGTRDVDATLGGTEPDMFGNPPVRIWIEQHAGIKLATHAQAAAQGEMVVNATQGTASLEALRAAGEQNLSGKVLMDISNPLDFSRGMPPTLTVDNTDSLGEQIQRAFPEAKVVKTLNTVNAHLMVAPQQLAGGDHTMFVCGNDVEAKRRVTDLLRSFGWIDILDLGDITNARGMEMYLPLWVRLYSATSNPMFNVKVVR